jgi:uncharacterized protein
MLSGLRAGNRVFSVQREEAISHIIIDGYNLIGISHKDLKRQRDLLIDALIEYGKRKNHDLTVVFDGWRTGQGQESRTVIGGVKVIYSRIGDKADAVIKRMISAERREWIVVTSDREIADHAWATGSIPVSSDDFLNALSTKDQSGIEEEDEYAEPRRKGSPRQLSKKEKAVRRAISKL